MFGVPSGPYLVIPLLGPSTVRDGTGRLVDRAFDPLTYLFGMGDLIFIGGSSGFVTREENAKALAALRELVGGLLRGDAQRLHAESRVAHRGAARAASPARARDGKAPETAAAQIDQLRSRSAGAVASVAMRSSSAEIRPCQPSRLISDTYSERRSASSLTVPFRYTSTIFQLPPVSRSR